MVHQSLKIYFSSIEFYLLLCFSLIEFYLLFACIFGFMQQHTKSCVV